MSTYKPLLIKLIKLLFIHRIVIFFITEIIADMNF